MTQSRMNCFAGLVLAILALCVSLLGVHCTELTFELEDNARQCFYEHLEKDAKGILEFQVRSLRQLGVVMLLGPLLLFVDRRFLVLYMIALL